MNDIAIGSNRCLECFGQSGRHITGCSKLEPQRGKWITFRPLTPKPKTKVWAVLSNDGGQIGTVAWYGPWRKYCFSPEAGTVFEQVCLRDIAQFCEAETRLHRTAQSVACAPQFMP